MCSPFFFSQSDIGKAIEKALEPIRVKLESISCLCAEGPEFLNKLELCEAIQKETLAALELIKKATDGK